jgi:uncharacterized protein YcfL
VRPIVMLLFMLLLAGCSSSFSNQIKDEKPKELEMTLESNPKQVQINEKITVTSNVTYGNKNISNDAEVMFEVIENGVSYGNLPVEPNANGTYQVELEFIEPGKHQVIAHVSYKDLHEMPILNLQVTE